MAEVTLGIDVGTTSVKAVAATGDGVVVARTRVRHPLVVPAPDLLEHDANRAWRRGVRRAFAEVRAGHRVRGVCVAAMVPSLCAVNRRGVAVTPGLLYGDARGRVDKTFEGVGDYGELLGFLRWCAAQAPHARGYWPAQAVANFALAGVAVMDSISAMSGVPLFAGAGWDEARAAEAGARIEQLPRVVPGHEPAGTVGEAVLAPGIIDALGEQLVAGADSDGDVLVILGATLITWAVIPTWEESPGLWTVPHTAPGKCLIGGPSNAGGIFLDWALRLAGAPRREAVEPGRVPVWTPYVRGERVPLHDPDRRAGLHGLDLSHDAAAVRRAAFEASGFVVRHLLERAGVRGERIVASGGGVRVPGWVQALADCTGLPVEVVAVPEGAALGAAFVARVAAGLEERVEDASRWARYAATVEPDPTWVAACEERYHRFLALTSAPSSPETGPSARA